MKKSTMYLLAGLGALLVFSRKGGLSGLAADYYDQSPQQMDDSFSTGDENPYAVEGEPGNVINEPGYGQPVYADPSTSNYWAQQQQYNQQFQQPTQQYLSPSGLAVGGQYTFSLTTPPAGLRPVPYLPQGYGYSNAPSNTYLRNSVGPDGSTTQMLIPNEGQARVGPYGQPDTVGNQREQQRQQYAQQMQYQQPTFSANYGSVPPGQQPFYGQQGCQSIPQNKAYGRTKCPPGHYKITIGRGRTRQMLCRPLQCSTNVAAQTLFGMEYEETQSDVGLDGLEGRKWPFVAPKPGVVQAMTMRKKPGRPGPGTVVKPGRPGYGLKPSACVVPDPQKEYPVGTVFCPPKHSKPWTHGGSW